MTGTGVTVSQSLGHASSGPATPRLLAKRYFSRPPGDEKMEPRGEFVIRRKGRSPFRRMTNVTAR
nr:MAG TPA: hypothetical protein [Inoviridae sp.]